jgi:hypothetical protein
MRGIEMSRLHLATSLRRHETFQLNQEIFHRRQESALLLIEMRGRLQSPHLLISVVTKSSRHLEMNVKAIQSDQRDRRGEDIAPTHLPLGLAQIAQHHHLLLSDLVRGQERKRVLDHQHSTLKML